jgi:hypothetical protein
MNKGEFISEIILLGYMWSEHEHEGIPGIAIRKADTRFFISDDGIEAQDWSAIKKGIPNLTHMTRIAGYYSRVNNWNKSKLGELKDRHVGDYSLSP